MLQVLKEGKIGRSPPILSRSRDSLGGFVPWWKKLIAFQPEKRDNTSTMTSVPPKLPMK